jgi:hypothetical protein
MKGGVAQLHAEIAHPINRDCRERVHKQVIEAYETERREFNESGGTRRYDMDDDRPAPGSRHGSAFDDMDDDEGSSFAPRRRSPVDQRDADYAPSTAKDALDDGFGKGVV